MRVAAIDCGTNSIRLLVADIDVEAGTLTDVDRRMEIVRLGEGVDQTGRLSDAALARTFAACEVYASVIESLGAERTRFVATSASRDAQNRADFVAGVLARIGVEPEVVTGDEEARLSFTGATKNLMNVPPMPIGGHNSTLTTAGNSYLVVDIGGGSTEFVVGADEPEAARSVDMGCVRLTERHLRSDPPTQQEIDDARATVNALIDEAASVVPLDASRTLIGLAGSVTTVAAQALNLPEYDSERIHGSRISAEQVHQVAKEFLAMTRAERAALPFMHPGRVDVIGGGALVLDEIVRRTGVSEIVVSEHDILDGIAFSLT